MSVASTLQNPRNVATGATTNENFLAGVTRALQKSGQVKVEQGPAMPCQSLRRQKTFPPRITRAIYCQEQETRLSPFTAHESDNWPNVGFYRFTYGKDLHVLGFQVVQAQCKSSNRPLPAYQPNHAT